MLQFPVTDGYRTWQPGTAPKDGIDLEMSHSDSTEDLEKPTTEQPPVRLMCLAQQHGLD